MRMWQFVRIGFAVILGIPAALVSIIFVGIVTRSLVLRAMGYEMSNYHLAERIVRNGESPDRCLRLQFTLPNLGPTLYEMRQNCLYEVAKATGNLQACQLILPDRYASYCIGEVHQQMIIGIGCSTDQRKIYCSSGLVSKFLGISSCNKYKDEDAREWCHTERTATLPGVHECDKISADQPSYREECEFHYAFKLKDRKHCAVITDEKRRKLCEVKIDVELQYGDQWREEEEHRPTYILRIGTGSYEY